MASINFDDGKVSFVINGDKNRVLRFNPADIGLADRINESMKKLQKKMEALKDREIKTTTTGDAINVDHDLAIVSEINKEMRESFDSIFYTGASDIVFGNMNPIALCNGKTIYESFMEEMLKVIKPYMKKETEQSHQRMSKYKDTYDRLPAGNGQNK